MFVQWRLTDSPSADSIRAVAPDALVPGAGGSPRVALITGISRGLGFALARELARRGWRIAGCARDAEALEQACRGLATEVHALAGDVSDSRCLRELVESTVRRWGRLDALVNNASTLGPLPLRPLLDLTETDLAHIFRVNITAPLELMQLAYPHLRRTRGLVINLSSDAAVAGYPAWGGYGASKAALDLLSRTAAAEWKDDGIRVWAVDPGDMHTDLHLAAVPGETEGLADPVDVARALLPLFSDAPPHPSGCRLRIAVPGLYRD